MKKTFLTLMFAAMSFMTFGQRWTALSSETPARPQVELISSSEEQIVVNFSLGGFYTNRVETPKGIQHTISAPKMAANLIAGTPDLPQFPIPAIIGDRAEMQVSVIDAQFTDFSMEVAPSKGNINRQVNPADVPYTYGAMYSQDAFYPAAQAHLEAPYISRDFRGQNIMVTPFAYNPVTKTLRVYTHMTIAMNKVSDNGENQKLARKSNNIKVDPEMKQAYSRRFINFGQTRYDFTEDRGSMLVICPEQYMEAMQPLVDWKNQSGRPCTMVSVAEAGGNNNNNIKAFIQDLYDKENLEFILLVGDYSDLTPHSMNGGCSDNWFGQLEGNDYYLEAFVGRFSVESVHDVETHVNKVLYYERDMDASVTWVNQGVGIGYIGAGNGHYGEDDYQHIDKIRDTLEHYTYEHVSELHGGNGGSASQQSISNAFNNGASIANYCNHGSETSWGVANYSNSHVNALTNDNMLPYIWSVACLNGKFNHNQPCFGETWLRATNNTTGAPTGAVGGMFSWISQPWIPPMYGQDEMVAILTEWRSADLYNHTFGGTSMNGNDYILDAAPSDNGDTHNTWILFGDPSLLLRTDNPVSMNAIASPSTLMIGMNELTVNAETQFGIATLSRTTEGAVEMIGSAYIENGTANISFLPLDNMGDLTLTVIGYNKVTEIINIEVIPADGAFLTVSDYAPRFAPVNQETSLSLSLKNVGNDPTQNTTTIVLSCDDEAIQFTNAETTIDFIGGNEIIELADAFSFIIAEGVEDEKVFSCIATMTCGDETWTARFNIIAAQAILEIEEIAWKGDFVPGESIDLVLGVYNLGHWIATNAIATISTDNQYVTITEATKTLGSIDPEGLGVAAFNISIDPACPETEQIVLNFDVMADAGVTTQGCITLRNSCVIIFELHDSYGDGWNGASLTASFSDGTPDQNMTIGSGNSVANYEFEIGNGVHVTLTWHAGSWDSECSYEVKYADGTLILQNSGAAGGEFDVNCSACGSVNFFDPVENLQAHIEGDNVVVTWDAIPNAGAYLITRNGIEIDEITEPIFIDEEVAADFYTYCVVAIIGENYSLPACVEIENVLGMEEAEVEFMVYPNPVNNTLYINGGSQYSYVMFNGMGQQVAAGEASGSHGISVSSLSQGIYFIRLTNGAQVSVQKVVVE